MTGEIYLEIYPVDKALRVTAIDPVTGLEVVFAAPSLRGARAHRRAGAPQA
jgi:hypothetical protein